MWFSIVFLALFIIIMPVAWLVAWRSKFMLEKHTGMRTEVQREQTAHFVKTTGPIWLMLVLVEADQIIHLSSVPRDLRMVWLGFFSASLLFLTPMFIINMKEFSRKIREKRQQELQRKDVV